MEELMQKYRYLVRKGLKIPQSSKLERKIAKTKEQLEGYREELELIAWVRVIIETEDSMKDTLLCDECPFWKQRHACYLILGLGALAKTKTIGSKTIMNFFNEIDVEFIKKLEELWVKLNMFIEDLD